MAKRVPNPYRPGFNQTPLALAGRDRVLDSIDEVLAIAALDGRTPRPLALTGSRGVGKTVILGEAAARAADQHSWLTAPVEVRPDASFVPQLIERLLAVRDLYRQTKPGASLTVTGATVRATVLGVGGSVEISRAARPVGDDPVLPLEAALSEACEAAAQHGAGVLLTVDELQLAARADLGDLAATLQQHVPDGWPLVVILAGLPTIRSTHRGVTYLERAEWQTLRMLDRGAATEALQAPARAAGRPMTDDAARMLAEASGGYPYAVQLMGHHAWRVSAGSRSIERVHAGPAIDAADEELAEGLYAARWDDSSEREREYLAALAALSGEHPRVTGAMVANRLGKAPKALSYLRDRIIQKGTVFPEGEALRFAVPGMADWLRERPEVTS